MCVLLIWILLCDVLVSVLCVFWIRLCRICLIVIGFVNGCVCVVVLC